MKSSVHSITGSRRSVQTTSYDSQEEDPDSPKDQNSQGFSR